MAIDRNPIRVRLNGRMTTRRSLLTGSLAAATALGIVTATGGRADAAPPFRISTEEEHRALPIAWGYPFSSLASRNFTVDGYPGNPYAGHSGVDYFSTPRIGAPIHSVADGRVIEVSNPLDTERDLGQFVRVAHSNGLYSSYGHMTPGSTRVAVGQWVGRGDPLGSTGWSGRVIPKSPETAHLHLTIYSQPGADPIIWNPLWLVDDAPLAQPVSFGEDDDLPFLIQTPLGHIYTVGQQYIRHETSMPDVAFLQTVYSKFVICRTDAQFRAVMRSLSIPTNVPGPLRRNGGGAAWAA